MTTVDGLKHEAESQTPEPENRAAGGGASRKGLSRWAGNSRLALARLRRSPSLLFGVIVCTALLITAFGANVLAPYRYDDGDLSLRYQKAAWMPGGSWSHPLGTDHVGRDVLSRIIYGTRTSLLIGVGATLASAILGLTLGVLAGYYGGAVEALIMRVADVQWSFPYVVLAIALGAVLGPSIQLIILVLGVSGWVSYGRVARASVRTLKTLDFIVAARAIGAPPAWVMLKHYIPNVFAPILVISTFEVASNILAESSLSFLGLGVQPPTPSWGGMINEVKEYVFTQGWMLAFPGLAISLTVLGINQLGDGLRDLLDPHLRGRL